MRRPSLSQMFGLGTDPGICECLQDERDLVNSVYHLEGSGLLVFAGRQRPEESSGTPAIRKTVCNDGSADGMV